MKTFPAALALLVSCTGTAQQGVPPAQESPGLRYYYPLPSSRQPRVIESDICVYGGISGGVVAAVQARRMGKSVVIAEFSRHLGGLSSGGLGATDIGNKGAIGGLSRDFYRRLGVHYGNDENWTFEPSVAERTFDDMVRESAIPVFFEQRLRGVKKEGNRIVELRMESGHVFRAKIYIDCTYEGDLMAFSGVTYTVGREANAQYGETYNGVHFGNPNHNFKVPVDPYVKEGDPSSGLLQGISAQDPGEQGSADHRVQAYNFRLCLTRASDRLPFPKPRGYDPERYTLLARYLKAGVWDAMKLHKMMPNGKTDLNNFGGFSSDNIGMNYEWPDGMGRAWRTGKDPDLLYEVRERVFQDHVTYQQGLMWFLANDDRVPEKVREEVRQWGLPRDEFRETGGWPHALYIREGRRMVSDYVMTQHECQGRRRVEDGVGLAAYTMDSHNCQRVARGGRVVNEGNAEYGGFPPYPISYRSIVPRESECENLFVPACLSSSHIAYGSIRMEPVFMVLAQSAATAASMAIDAGVAVQRVDFPRLRERLLADQQVLDWTAGGKR